MTEAEWLAGHDPGQMFQFVVATASQRRARLLGVGRCRRLWELFEAPRSRLAIDVAEQLADGAVSEAECRQAQAGAEAALDDRREQDTISTSKEFILLSAPENAAIAILDSDPKTAAGCGRGVAYCLDFFVNPLASKLLSTHDSDEVCLLHCIFGNPFRPVTLGPPWRTSTTVALAQQMYESRDFSAMPILADALQDAGCEHLDILGHCRGAGVHVRGCWVVDLVLAKQ